jgi:hypothetical protein
MPKSAQLARLKLQLAANRRSLNELAASTRRLHELVNGVIDESHSNESKGSAKRTSSEPKPKRSGNSLASATARRAASSKRLASSTKQDLERRAIRQKLATALERHWGNLF